PTRKKTRQIPAHIPRTTILSEPPEDQRICHDCGTHKHCIGSESSEVLEWEPGGFRVEVTERRKYACRRCGCGVVMGPGPSRVLPQAMPGAGLLAEVVVRKIKDSCPLDRQSRIFSERFGVPLSPSTLGEWLAGTADVLAPLSRRLREQGLQSPHLSFDDTPIRVLDPTHEKGVKRGHLWSFVSDEPLVFYEYTPSWSGAPIQSLLSDYSGTLQSDGYSGINTLHKRGRVIRFWFVRGFQARVRDRWEFQNFGHRTPTEALTSLVSVHDGGTAPCLANRKRCGSALALYGAAAGCDKGKSAFGHSGVLSAALAGVSASVR
ncbi:MAG TPA: IS66 family transposase, partial [Pseudomonadota bacterium]|nr:IS66 family transposase [Pseudomonadota bacterium]